jgi:DNA polymerase-3 subunit beta
VKLNTDELLNSVSRASLITDESKNSLIKMSYTDEKLSITSESDIGKVAEEVNINKNGEDLKIAFNSKFFVEVLKIINDDRIIIEFKDKLSPTLIKPVDSDKYVYLIMPVRYVE